MKNKNSFIIPKGEVMLENEIFIEAEKESNIPLTFWSKWRKFYEKREIILTNVETCDTELPSPQMIHYNNIYWQQTNINGVKIFLYNAYFDNRESIKKVRVLTVTEDQNKMDVFKMKLEFG
jgi:hypothetical protein